nr:MAG TPA: cell cycle control protein [Caudoviricetes sp.]
MYCGKCGKWQKWITKQELQILGKYEIEERAKEVLQEIIKSYRYYRTAECDGYTNVLQETAVFEMPED